MRRKKQLKGFWVYTGLLLLAVVTIYPMQQTALEASVAQYGVELPLPLPVMVLIGLLQPFLLGLIGIYIGQSWAPKVGLRSLVYEKLDLQNSVGGDFKKSLPLALLGGAVVGAVIIGFDFWMAPVLPDVFIAPMTEGYTFHFPSLIMALLYGGIAEELMLRWGFMTFLVYVFTRRGKFTSTFPYALAIFISALLFALGHYGATASLTEMTYIVWFRMLLLNGIGGILFGWLYYKFHLEAAIVAHMTAHITMEAAALLLFGLLI